MTHHVDQARLALIREEGIPVMVVHGDHDAV